MHIFTPFCNEHEKVETPGLAGRGGEWEKAPARWDWMVEMGTEEELFRAEKKVAGARKVSGGGAEPGCASRSEVDGGEMEEECRHGFSSPVGGGWFQQQSIMSWEMLRNSA
ncbi:hypothetical protein ACLOJK_015888 [Asimina triloba]